MDAFIGLTRSPLGRGLSWPIDGACCCSYAARPSTCGPHDAQCFKTLAHNFPTLAHIIALSLFRPRWRDALKLTCHMGLPVTLTLAVGLHLHDC